MRDPHSSGSSYDENEISECLLQVPMGHHYLVLYPNIETIRKVYGTYIKKQIEEQPDSLELFPSYFDTTDNVRRTLYSKDINVKELEKNGSIIILDIMKVINDPLSKVHDIERLRELVKKTYTQFKDKTVYIIADLSAFHHIKKVSELLEYEKTMRQDLKVGKSKGLCLYHKRDFEMMFSEDDSDKLKVYHNNRVILVN